MTVALGVTGLVACGGGGGSSAPAPVSVAPPTPPTVIELTASEKLREDLTGLSLESFFDTSFEALEGPSLEVPLGYALYLAQRDKRGSALEVRILLGQQGWV
ncbi:MAG: hypothetical protein AB8G18_16135 [Gammaproteobacteria bacterium]